MQNAPYQTRFNEIRIGESSFPIDLVAPVKAATEAIKNTENTGSDWISGKDGKDSQRLVVRVSKLVTEAIKLLKEQAISQHLQDGAGTVWIGGELPRDDGYGKKLSDAVGRLLERVENTLSRVRVVEDAIVYPSADRMREEIEDRMLKEIKSRKTGVFAKNPARVQIKDLCVLGDDGNPSEAVALAFIARETVNGSNLDRAVLSRLKASNRLVNNEIMDGFKRYVRPEIEKFLDRYAFGRVRTEIACDLMENIAGIAKKSGNSEYSSLVRYIEKVLSVRRDVWEGVLCPQIKVQGLPEVSLIDWIPRVGLYSALPVWARYHEQLTWDVKGEEKVREINYRFGVNGQTQSGKSAFEERLERIWNALKENNGRNASLGLAQMMFLALVLLEDGQQRIRGITSLDDVQRVLDDLSKQARFMDDVSRGLRLALRRQAVIRSLSYECTYTIALKEDLINWDVLSWSSPLDEGSYKEVFPWPSGDDRTLAKALDNIVVYKGDGAASHAFVRWAVGTQINSVLLVPSDGNKGGQNIEYRWTRDVKSGYVLPFFMILGDQASKQNGQHVLKLNRGVFFLYQDDPLRQRSRHDSSFPTRVVLHTIVTYVVLDALVRLLKKRGIQVAHVMGLRRQIASLSNSKDGNAADSVIYAISRAVEAELSEEVPTHVQGLSRDSDENQYAIDNATRALFSGLPIFFSMEGRLDKVGIVAYGERPCGMTMRLVRTQCYVAERDDQKPAGFSARLRKIESPMWLVESGTQSEIVRPLGDVLKRFSDSGFKHVIVIWHRYGSGRTYPELDVRELVKLIGSFPDLHVYPMQFGSLSTVRLRKRADKEVFEARLLSGLEGFSTRLNNISPHSQVGIAVYAFATLRVVGDDETKPQSTFSFYLYTESEEMRAHEHGARALAEIAGVGGDESRDTRDSLVSALRAIHFHESEIENGPVIEPFSFMKPDTIEAAGEVEVKISNNAVLVLPAVLAHVGRSLRGVCA